MTDDQAQVLLAETFAWYVAVMLRELSTVDCGDYRLRIVSFGEEL